MTNKEFNDSIRTKIYSYPDDVIKLSKKFLLEADFSNKKDIVDAYSALGVAHEIKNNIDSTLYYYYKALNLVEEPNQVIQFKYSIAGIFLREKSYQDALELYNQSLLLAKQSNSQEAVNKINRKIAIIRNEIGQVGEAVRLLKEIYLDSKSANDVDLKFIRKDLIEAYLKNKNFKESESLINEGITEAKADNNKEFLFYMNSLLAKSYLLQARPNEAMQSINLTLEIAKYLKNQEFIDESYFLQAEIYLLSKSYSNAIEALKKTNTSDKTKSSEQLSKYYKLMAEAYKELDSMNISNNYLQRYIEEKDKVSSKRLYALEKIHDISLNEEVSKKEIQAKKKSYWIVTSLVLLALIIIFIARYFRIKARNQKRFDALMDKITAYENSNKVKADQDLETSKEQEKQVPLTKPETTPSIIHVDKKDKNNQEKDLEEIEKEQEDTTFSIDDEKVDEILKKIQTLEDKMYFLRQDCTLHNMAKKLKTNTSYLSKIINTHLDKSFSTYINELRINYAILELKSNKKLQAYSVKGIAEEMGYKNADSFSRYFKSATGITPSVYLDKIKNVK
ncbi:helix-turn-helix domain-containing protein [Corallibacter sp.]|uniref:helix-turn-helix domain-containing protein n=1 Tax=Corallibacter sp. TaxID=2038084 RepID=UPI003A8CE7DE